MIPLSAYSSKNAPRPPPLDRRRPGGSLGPPAPRQLGDAGLLLGASAWGLVWRGGSAVDDSGRSAMHGEGGGGGPTRRPAKCRAAKRKKPRPGMNSRPVHIKVHQGALGTHEPVFNGFLMDQTGVSTLGVSGTLWHVCRYRDITSHRANSLFVSFVYFVVKILHFYVCSVVKNPPFQERASTAS